MDMCLRKQIMWTNLTGEKLEEACHQLTELPRALVDEDGLPVKGNKVRLSQHTPTNTESNYSLQTSQTNGLQTQSLLMGCFYYTSPLRVNKQVSVSIAPCWLPITFFHFTYQEHLKFISFLMTQIDCQHHPKGGTRMQTLTILTTASTWNYHEVESGSQ